MSATHGTAHLALYDDMIWDKHQFAGLTNGKFTSNTLSKLPAATASDALDFQKADGFYSPAANRIPVQQRRGAVFIACHNQVWEITAGRIKAGVTPDRLSHEAMAAEFTNHPIAGVCSALARSALCPSFSSRGSAMQSSTVRTSRFKGSNMVSAKGIDQLCIHPHARARSPGDWQLTHLHDPQSVVPGSAMPPYPWLFDGSPARPTAAATDLLAYLNTLGRARRSPGGATLGKLADAEMDPALMAEIESLCAAPFVNPSQAIVAVGAPA